MVAISKKEYIIYKQIKILSLEYENRIPLNILNMELEIYEKYLGDVLNDLTSKGIILQENNNVGLNKSDKEIVVVKDDETNNVKEVSISKEEMGKNLEDSTVKSNGAEKIKEGIVDLKLNEKEKKSLKIIVDLVKDDKTVSRHLLEGNLLYGELKLSNFSMYHVLLSLENNDLIKMTKKVDGDYYKLLI